MEMFIVIGVLLVTGGVMVIMFNSDILLTGLMRVFGRRKSLCRCSRRPSATR